MLRSVAGRVAPSFKVVAAGERAIRFHAVVGGSMNNVSAKIA
jgi:hypothetical protein